MLKILETRLRQGCRTSRYPEGAAELPERFRGRPQVRPGLCSNGCSACAEVCPTQAIRPAIGQQALSLDLGRCLFCTECVTACPEGAVSYTRDHGMAASRREDLILAGGEMRLAEALDEKSRRLFGRSLKLRQVSAGGCSACEAELAALNNVVFDLGRFGVSFVASPRHADGLVITGPVTENMREALLRTYEAVPSPKIVIAVGACAISGGPFVDGPQVHNGADSAVPVDLYIPGCPPHPLTILDGLLRLLGRLEDGADLQGRPQAKAGSERA